MNLWKVVGLAGVVGATVVGIAAGTNAVQNHRREFIDADHGELRERLHQRLAQAKARQAESAV